MTFREVEKLLLTDGWKFKNARGSHNYYIHPLTLPTAKAGGFSVQPPQPAHARSYTVSPSV